MGCHSVKKTLQNSGFMPQLRRGYPQEHHKVKSQHMFRNKVGMQCFPSYAGTLRTPASKCNEPTPNNHEGDALQRCTNFSQAPSRWKGRVGRPVQNTLSTLETLECTDLHGGFTWASVPFSMVLTSCMIWVTTPPRVSAWRGALSYAESAEASSESAPPGIDSSPPSSAPIHLLSCAMVADSCSGSAPRT